MSFSSACRSCRALLCLLDSPCRLLAFTSCPHGQVWGSHDWIPNLKPTAIRIISPLILNPIEVIGGAISQSPEWGDDADRIQALSISEKFEIKSWLIGCWWPDDPKLYVCADLHPVILVHLKRWSVKKRHHVHQCLERLRFWTEGYYYYYYYLTLYRPLSSVISVFSRPLSFGDSRT